MPSERLASWMDRVAAEYEASRLQAGDSPEEARTRAQATRDNYLPGGSPAPDHLIFDVLAGAEPGAERVGYLWIGVREAGEIENWWVWDIEIDEPHRGAGHGRAAMSLAERAAAEHGALTLGLNVFGYNTAARGLYESLGYDVTALQMRKDVASA